MCSGPKAPDPPPPPPAAPPVLEQEAPRRSGENRSSTKKSRAGLSKYKINKAGRRGSKTNSLGNVPQA